MGSKHWLMEKSQVAKHGRLRRMKERTEEDGVGGFGRGHLTDILFNQGPAGHQLTGDSE